MNKKSQENEPEIDESLLTPAQKKLMHEHTFNWKWGLFWGIIVTLMLICLNVIVVLYCLSVASLRNPYTVQKYRLLSFKTPLNYPPEKNHG